MEGGARIKVNSTGSSGKLFNAKMVVQAQGVITSSSSLNFTDGGTFSNWKMEQEFK